MITMNIYWENNEKRKILSMKYLERLQELLRFKFCTSFYLLFCVIIVGNEMFWKQEYLSVLCRYVIYVILVYKGVKILGRYYKASKKDYLETPKQEFRNKFRWFRIQVSLWWIAFTIICGVVKFVWNIHYNYYFGLSFLLLATDLLFVNETCLLQIFSDPKAKVVKCCCGCPVRGWDLLMINTPLLFAFNPDRIFENICTICVLILAVISFICWEQSKYILVENKEKCQKSCELRMCIENRVR